MRKNIHRSGHVCLHVWAHMCNVLLSDSLGIQDPPSFNLKPMGFSQRELPRDLPTVTLLCLLFLEGTMLTQAESMTSAVWINKERKSSLSPEETDSEVEGTLEDVDRSCHQAPETPWHTYLEMHRLVQTLHLETGHQGNPKGNPAESEPRFSPEGDPHVLENHHKTQQETEIAEATQCQSQEGCGPLQAASSGLPTGIQCLSSTKNLHRSGKPTHYPFPQRKLPRISQAARNLGLYGPP